MPSGFDESERSRFADRGATGHGAAMLIKFLLTALGCALFLALVIVRG